MLKVEKTEVVGWEHALRGMRNPKNSWDKSDSGYVLDTDRDGMNFSVKYVIGDNDRELAEKLNEGGPVHAKYRRMIVVYADVTAPLYWWKEYDTYKVGTVANSCSTMHKLMDHDFTLDDFSHEHLDNASKLVLTNLIEEININRQWYLNYEALLLDPDFKAVLPEDKKQLWWNIIQLLPSSYNQKRTVMLNYEVLSGMYHSRKHHKLDEWHEFCAWVESLPASFLITGEE